MRFACCLILLSIVTARDLSTQTPGDPPPPISALEELGGRQLAHELRFFSARRPEVEAAAERIGREGDALLSSGSPHEAGRRFALAAELLERAAGLPPHDAGGGQRTRVAAGARWEMAADAYLAGGDSARARAALFDQARLTLNYRAAERAFTLVQAARYADALAMLLDYELLLRRGGNDEDADSALIFACRNACGAMAADPDALVETLLRSMRSDTGTCRCGPIFHAVRALLVEAAYGETPADVGTRLGLRPLSHIVAAPTDSLAAAGRRDEASELLLAHAYTLIPARRIAGDLATAHQALDVARAALALRGPGEAIGRARTLSIIALAHAHAAQIDSATSTQRQAEALAAGGPPALRSHLRRRGAVIAAIGRDSVAAVRLVTEAVALRGADDANLAPWDRHAVARALIDCGGAEAAVRLAASSYESVRGAGTVENVAEVAMTLGAAYRAVGMPDSARRYFRAAADGFASKARDAQAAHVLLAMVEQALEVGRFDEARALHEEAGVTLRQSIREDRGLGARLLNDHGLLAIATGRVDDARLAFSLAAEHAGPSHPEFGEAQRGLALITLRTGVGDRDSAISSIAREVGGGIVHPYLHALWPARPRARPFSDGLFFTELAALHLERGRLPDAYVQLRDAADALRETGHAPSIRRLHELNSVMYARLGRADSATYYRLAVGAGGAQRVAAGSGRFADVAVWDGSSIRQAIAGRSTADALRLLRDLLAASRERGDTLAEGHVLGALGHFHFRSRSHSDLTTATAYYDSALVRLRDVVWSPTAWSYRSGAWERLPEWLLVHNAEQSALVHGETVLAWLARSTELGPTQAALGALGAADLARGRVFATLARERGVQRGGISGAILESASLSGPLPEVGEQLLHGGLGSYRSLDAPRRLTLSFALAGDTLVTWLHATADLTRAESLEIFRRAITADSLAALVTAARSSLGADAADTRAPPALESPALHRGLGLEGGAADDDHAMRQLAELLLPTALREMLDAGVDLLVVAGGPIAAVPFAALFVDSTDARLGERAALRYAPSLALLSAVRSERAVRIPSATSATRREWLQRAVVLGNPSMPAVAHSDGMRRALAPLPGAEREADRVATLMGVRPLTGGEATLAALRARAEQATLLHLATHGYAFGTESKVEDSFVALAPTATHDGLLTVREMMHERVLRLPHAELVVLSACQTGLGQLTTSEGTLGLQRAFLLAGAENVLVSLWSVSDSATALLLTSFYRYWLEGDRAPNKAEALRRAQADLRGVERFAHPRYWAAFQLVGVG